jgi:hypothetical protein
MVVASRSRGVKKKISMTKKPPLDPMVTRRMCRHLCDNMPKPKRAHNQHYKFGDKFCRKCDRFFFPTTDILCKCCGMQLRTARRGKNNRNYNPESPPVKISDEMIEKIKNINSQEEYDAVFGL